MSVVVVVVVIVVVVNRTCLNNASRKFSKNTSKITSYLEI